MLGRPMPNSKRDSALPYTYEACVDRFRGEASRPLEWSYFSDTLCGIVRLLIEKGFEPQDVRLFGAYGRRSTALDVDLCVDDDGQWITPPQLCHALEERYRRTLDERYFGHVEHGECMFEDRDQTGKGPY